VIVAQGLPLTHQVVVKQAFFVVDQIKQKFTRRALIAYVT
jgi:hypothetical protein